MGQRVGCPVGSGRQSRRRSLGRGNSAGVVDYVAHRDRLPGAAMLSSSAGCQWVSSLGSCCGAYHVVVDNLGWVNGIAYEMPMYFLQFPRCSQKGCGNTSESLSKACRRSVWMSWMLRLGSARSHHSSKCGLRAARDATWGFTSPSPSLLPQASHQPPDICHVMSMQRDKALE